VSALPDIWRAWNRGSEYQRMPILRELRAPITT
jgi:hypothetical protein